MGMTLDDYFNPSRERYLADRQRWTQQAEAAALLPEDVQQRERQSQKVAEDVAQYQRDQLAAQALSQVTMLTPPEGAPSGMAAAYAELNRQRQAEALAEAEADRRDPQRLQARAVARRLEWEREFEKQHHRVASMEELEQGGVMDPDMAAWWTEYKKTRGG